MRLRIFALATSAAFAACGSIAWAQTALPAYQEAVECTGWHALCDFAVDCRVNLDGTASCACWRVNENYMVGVSNIKNSGLKAATQAACTKDYPCGVDEAPVCAAIQSGTYTVDGDAREYEWVSTYSYRGWCDHWNPVRCEGREAGPWADCMTSPCIETKGRIGNPDRPLTCRCTIETSAFIGSMGSCRTRPGEVMSTIPRVSWDFRNAEFAFPMPGYDEYVKRACGRLRSDRDLGD
jgi:hypothetical protein